MFQKQTNPTTTANHNNIRLTPSTCTMHVGHAPVVLSKKCYVFPFASCFMVRLLHTIMLLRVLIRRAIDALRNPDRNNTINRRSSNDLKGVGWDILCPPAQSLLSSWCRENHTLHLYSKQGRDHIVVAHWVGIYRRTSTECTTATFRFLRFDVSPS
jgi:hypothetical protein